MAASNNVLSVGATGFRVSHTAASASGTIPNAADANKPKYARICATTACYVRWGKGAQTAVNTDMYLPANWAEVIECGGADTIASIRDTADGVLVVTPLEWAR